MQQTFLGPSVADEELFEEETNSLIQPEQRLKDAWVSSCERTNAPDRLPLQELSEADFCRIVWLPLEEVF